MKSPAKPDVRSKSKSAQSAEKRQGSRPAAAKDSAKLRALKQSFSSFLKLNPGSTILEYVGPPSTYYIFEPWSDRSVAIQIPDDPTALKDALEKLVLPNRLTALYHTDLKTLEVIWTAYRLPDNQVETAKRSFKIDLDGSKHTCTFKKSSDRLLTIAESAVYLRVSDSGFRNLQSFTTFMKLKSEDEERGFRRLGSPVSFFITNVKWSEEKTLNLIRHLNFYLRYYDTASPVVQIQPPTDDTSVTPPTRYREGTFPKDLSGRTLNPTLLEFWLASESEEAATSFLLRYRILEFVTTYYLEAEQRTAVRKVLSSPNIRGSLASAMDNLVALIREERPDNVTRFVRMVRDLVKEDLIWREICLNPDAFSKLTEFDGGFKLPALVANTASMAAFGPQGMENFARSLRKIRNALAHGGEAQSGQIILPTSQNVKRLQPWVNLIGTAAAEVVLYEHLT